jgi:hypothetical protein
MKKIVTMAIPITRLSLTTEMQRSINSLVSIPKLSEEIAHVFSGKFFIAQLLQTVIALTLKNKNQRGIFPRAHRAFLQADTGS